MTTAQRTQPIQLPHPAPATQPVRLPPPAPATQPVRRPQPARFGEPAPAAAGLAAPRRVTVCAPDTRRDLALPAQCTIAELVADLVELTGTLVRPAGRGWVLHRLGEPPLPPNATVAAAGIGDGDLLHLVPVEQAARGVVFDDTVDAIADAVRRLPFRWSPAASRRVAATAAGLLLGAWAILLTAAASASGLAAPAAAGTALVLLAAGTAVARLRGDRGVGTAVAAAGLPAALAAGAAAAGALPLAGAGTGSPAAGIAAGTAAAAGYALAALLAVGEVAAGLVAVAGLTGAAALTAAVVAGGAPPAPPVAVAIAVAVVVSTTFPQLSLRVGALPAPRITLDPRAFRAGEAPVDAPALTAGARAATASLTGLLTAVATAVPAGAAVLLAGADRWAWGLGMAAGAALVLRSRAYAGADQRAVLLVGGTVTLLATAGRFATAGGPVPLASAAAGALLVGACAAGHAVRAPSGTPSPYWSRLLDLLEFSAVTAMVPLVVAVTGLYARLRGIGA